MKKIILLVVFLCTINWMGYAKKPVKFLIWDVGKMAKLGEYQAFDMANYISIVNAQKSQIESEKIILDKLAKIDTLEHKMQDYRSTLQDIMTKANPQQSLDSMMMEIIKQQLDIQKIANRCPIFKDLADAANIELANRAKIVIKYIEKCGRHDGIKGQLDNKERTDITLFVVKELLSMKGVSSDVLQILTEGEKIYNSRQKSIEDYKDLMIINVASN